MLSVESAAEDTAGRRLRVAIVGDYPESENGVHKGGVQSVTHGLAHAMARRDDIECHVVSTIPPKGSVTYRRAGNLHVHYVRRLPIPRLASCKLHDVPELVRVVRAINPDVVHGQGQDCHGLAALRAGFPTVITSHGVTFVECQALKRHRFDLLGAWKVRTLIGWEREVFAGANEMIVISRYLPEVYGSMLRARTSFIENPISPSFYSLHRTPVLGRLLFVGTVVPRKCIHDLVRAFAHLRDRIARDSVSDPWVEALELRIVGPPSHEPTELLLRRVIAELGLERQVVLIGAIGEGELMDEYSRAHALVLGSREETAPQAIAQAMACGLPVVASAVGGVPAMINEGITGLLFPFGDAQRCSDQIFRLLRDEPLRERISQRVRVEALGRFHPDSVAQQTAVVYRRAVQSSRQHPEHAAAEACYAD